ncbi:MAG: hypothetical protein APR63_10280 [Desulfuromonas sp. SDB]|nr:MAG: hypothetical protein APR63_10280 [Desulfuromonas sp. SDB]
MTGSEDLSSSKHKIFINLYQKLGDNRQLVRVEPLTPSGSSREYFRITSGKDRAIGMYNPDVSENMAFQYLTDEFAACRLKVPRILISYKNQYYLLEDLGDMTLFDFIRGNNFNSTVVDYLKICVQQLLEFQVRAGLKLDFSRCYPQSKFDQEAMLMDLNYFKYYFLKLKIPHLNEHILDGDFNLFSRYLLQAPGNFFMYRDFQSRNIMIVDEQLYFIDFQGGRQGPLQYDLGSLLFQARAEIPDNIRQQIMNFYLTQLDQYNLVNCSKFTDYYYDFVLIRIFQTLGAYGFRGLIQQKPHFIKSIPLALKNLDEVLAKTVIPLKCKYLYKLLLQLLENEQKFQGYSDKKLKLTIYSFAYASGIPTDKQGHGGGFVFDCRCLDNPGKIKKYADLTGKSKSVQDFLQSRPEVIRWLNSAFDIVDQAVNTYQQRSFNSLTVCFGCTGGRHRSVFCAEKLRQHLMDKFDINLDLIHSVIGAT